MDFAILQQLGVALALASLIGLEREHKNQLHGQTNFGGVRTFALIGLFGALAYFFFKLSVSVFAVLTGGFLVLVVAAYFVTSKQHNDAGATSEIAAIMVYLIGVLSAMEEYLVATIIALAILLILHFKDPLHKWVRHIQSREIVSTMQFLIITFVVLPILPNKYYGPYDFFNPYIVWLMVVFISGISFLSYILIRIFGARKGLIASGFLAGFISSTALTFNLSEESRRNTEVVGPYVLAIVIASTAMFFRLLLEVFVLNKDLFFALLIPILIMGVVGISAGIFIWMKNKDIPNVVEKRAMQLKSPFSLWPALKFGVFFAGVLFLSNFAGKTFGNAGTYFTSIFSGILDVDAATISSLTSLEKGKISSVVAVNAIIIAAMTNTFAKGAIFLIFGNRTVALKIVAVFALMLVAGGVVVVAV